MKLEINCPFIRTLITCICNIDCSEANFLWQYCTVYHWYCSKDGSVWQAHSMYNAYFIQNPFFLHHPLQVFWAIVLLTIMLLHFWGDVLKFSRYIVIGKSPTHIFRRKNVTHLSPSLPVHITAGSSTYSDKNGFQTTTWCLQTKAIVRSRASVLRWRYCISKAYQLKYQAWWK